MILFRVYLIKESVVQKEGLVVFLAVYQLLAGELKRGFIPAPGETVPGFEDEGSEIYLAGAHPPIPVMEVFLGERSGRPFLIPDESGSPTGLLIYATGGGAEHLIFPDAVRIFRSNRAVIAVLPSGVPVACKGTGGTIISVA